MFKRIAVFLLSILLVVGNFSYVSANATTKTLPGNIEKKPIPEKLEETIDPDQEVRVVVEMEEAEPIEKATQQGVQIHRLKETEKQRHEKAKKEKKNQHYKKQAK